MNHRILTINIKNERDVVSVRRRARQITDLLGFNHLETTRIATAVSEIARNAFDYANSGKVEFTIEGKIAPQILLVRISDEGDGIKNLPEILGGNYKSSTGMGRGIAGSHRLVDDFKIETSDAGTIVELRKNLPKLARLVDANQLSEITDELLRDSVDNPFEEIQQQNQELLQALAELREKQEDLLQLNRELEDTNRGVVALYAELDQTADDLRKADIAKTQFLSNMSHEFRTPLNSQIALTRLLLDRMDGELSGKQEKQIRLIRRGAETLLELVNDLLDIAKIAAGKVEVHAEKFTVKDLFSTLRGMIRPLLNSESVKLIFEEPAAEFPPLFTDEGKVAQILRNFLSNALKFTVAGEVRVSAQLCEEKQTVIFSVADTGIGIASEDCERIFEEFMQIENPLQKSHKGTGLGLPLSRKLAELLGGNVAVESSIGSGTTFKTEFPRIFNNAVKSNEVLSATDVSQISMVSNSNKILIVDNDESARYVLKKLLSDLKIEIVEAANGAEGLTHAQTILPKAVLLDLEMPEMHGGEVLRKLKANQLTASIPVIIVTSEDLETCLIYQKDATAILNKKDLTIVKLREIFVNLGWKLLN